MSFSTIAAASFGRYGAVEEPTTPPSSWADAIVESYENRVIADGGILVDKSALVTHLENITEAEYNDSVSIYLPEGGYKEGKIYDIKSPFYDLTVLNNEIPTTGEVNGKTGFIVNPTDTYELDFGNENSFFSGRYIYFEISVSTFSDDNTLIGVLNDADSISRTGFIFDVRQGGFNLFYRPSNSILMNIPLGSSSTKVKVALKAGGRSTSKMYINGSDVGAIGVNHPNYNLGNSIHKLAVGSNNANVYTNNRNSPFGLHDLRILPEGTLNEDARLLTV